MRNTMAGLAHRPAWLLLAALSGCSLNPTLTDRVDVIDKATVEQAPLVSPTSSTIRSITSLPPVRSPSMSSTAAIPLF